MNRRAFLEKLEALNSFIDVTWALVDDFNTTKFHTERLEASGSNYFSQDFKIFINTLALIKINSASRFHEKANLAKLDRALVSLEWYKFFPLSSLILLACTLSNYVPLLLSSIPSGCNSARSTRYLVLLQWV